MPPKNGKDELPLFCGAGEWVIPIYDRNQGNLISEYGRLTVEKIKVRVQSFISQKSTQSQKSVQMYHCISKLLTKADHLNIVSGYQKYMMKGTPVDKLLLKLFMKKAVIDTKTTVKIL